MPSLKHAALLCAVLGMAAACAGGQSAAASKTRSSSPPAVAADGATTGASAAAQGGAGQAPESASFACSATTTGGTPGLRGQLTALRVGGHTGFDRITFEFAGQPGVPPYRLAPQAAAAFVKDPSGLPLHLAGSRGLVVSLPTSSGLDTSVDPPRRTYTGSQDLKPALASVREVAQLGDFEHVMSWGAGLSAPACMRISELSNPARLVLDVRPGPATPTAAELTAVAERIYHPIPGGFSPGCETQVWTNQTLCPITSRFVARLQQGSTGPGVDLFCRCQNGDPAIRNITADPTADGGIAHVTTGYSHVDLIIRNVGGKLLADDVQCPGGRPETSIYVSPLTAC